MSKTGIKEEQVFILSLVLNFVCGLYCFWLLSVVLYKMWNQPVARLQSVSMNREVQSVSTDREAHGMSQKDTTKVSVEVSNNNSMPSSENVKKVVHVDKRIKWVVTLYLFTCGLICFGMGSEHVITAIASPPGSVCGLALYVTFMRLVTDGFFFSFYLIRTTIALEGTVFEISKKRQYFLAIAPIVSFGSLNLFYQITLYLNHCEPSAPYYWVIVSSVILCHLFWNVTLFSFLAYHLHKVTTNEFMFDASLNKELKEYLKKLFLLFIIAQLATIAVYMCGFIPALFNFTWIIIGIDLCVSSTTMLLSFPFAKPVYNRICMCQRSL